MTKLRVREKQVVEELRKIKEDRDAIVEKLVKEIIVLKAKDLLTKKLAIEEYKSSYDF